METNSQISFDNTEYAFAYKSTPALRKAKFLFSSMNIGWLVQLGTRLTPLAFRLRLPVKALIRNTIFEQFVGGETLEETDNVVDHLAEFNVKVILDYGVEGKEGEESFEHAKEEFKKVIAYASKQQNIPFISIKVTGLARFALLEKLQSLMNREMVLNGTIPTEALSDAESEEWQRVEVRMAEIVRCAVSHHVGVLVDAEESWIQDPVDALTMNMMQQHNREAVIVFNTIQLYRHDRLQFLKESHQQAAKNNFLAGMKLVRGAYMEKERKRASLMGLPSPIQPDKHSTDRDYNEAVLYCITHLEQIFCIVASHNEESNLLAADLLKLHGKPADHPHIHFSQLYGMSDNITFNLAKAGCPVSKYLPFGPIKDVIPYLMRRAQENSSISGHTGRELGLIKKELKRRRA